MEPKLIFIDIDKTLTDKKHVVSDRTHAILNKLKENNVYCMIASARPRPRSKYLVEKHNMHHIAISANGSEIHDLKENKSLYFSKMDEVFLKEVFELAMSNPANKTRLKFLAGDYCFSTIQKYPEEIPFPEDMTNFFEEHPISQCTIVGEDYEFMHKLLAKVQTNKDLIQPHIATCLMDRNHADRSHAFFDFTNKGVSKGVAVELVCKYYNIDPKESVAIAIGDGTNDLTMFDVTGYSVAVANGTPKVKERANEVTAAHYNDGVAIFLERYLKNNFSTEGAPPKDTYETGIIEHE